MSLRIAKTAALALLFVAPACAVRLSDRNSPLPNGGVTGQNADCSQITPEPTGAPGGEAAPLLVGRFDMTDPERPRSDWSGNQFAARFEGSEVTIGLEVPDANRDVLFTAVIDDGEPFKFVVSGERENGVAKTGHTLATGLGPGPHSVLVHRDTEASSGGVVIFTGFNFGAGGKYLPPVQRPRKIEILGDSITCGYGNEGQHATCPFDLRVRDAVDEEGNPLYRENGARIEVRVPLSQNNYLAYGSVAARELDAEAVQLCWSGKGVARNYRETQPDGTPLEDALATMPDLYERTLANEPDTRWDFTKDPEYQVVVINLGTNDFARDELPPRNVADGIDLEEFRAAFMRMVQRVRQVRPNAHIFMAVPPMITDQFPLDDARSNARNVMKSVAAEFEANGDPRVYFIELVEQGTRYGLGCDYHPNLEVHRIMADQVAGAIRAKTCW
jgi:lysophospholipase L1-like esterase